MKKFFRKVSWFFVVIVTINLLYVLILFMFSPGFYKIYEMSSFEKQKFDVIALGNSMALDGIDAAYMSKQGIPTYNLSVAGNHVSTSLFLLKDYLKKNEKPKMVVVGLSSAIGKSYLNAIPFNNPEVEFFYHPSVVSNITNPPLLNFQWLVVDLIKIMISKDHRNATMVLGQWKTKKVIPDGSVFSSGNSNPIDYQDSFLRDIVLVCRDQGIKLVLVELPGCNGKQNNLPFEYVATLKNNMTHKVYNLNNNAVASSILNPATDWLAQDHLNEYGGKKVTAFLLERILSNEMNITISSQKKP